MTDNSGVNREEIAVITPVTVLMPLYAPIIRCGIDITKLDLDADTLPDDQYKRMEKMYLAHQNIDLLSECLMLRK